MLSEQLQLLQVQTETGPVMLLQKTSHYKCPVYSDNILRDTYAKLEGKKLHKILLDENMKTVWTFTSLGALKMFITW